MKETAARRLLVGLAAGVAFLVLDGVLNGNPLAQGLYAAYRPIARASVDPVAGSFIDLTYGLILVQVFVILRPSLPGRSPLTKGLAFGVLVWFLRVVMRVAGEWITMMVPAPTHAYTLVAGLLQVLLVTALIALLLPSPRAPGAA